MKKIVLLLIGCALFTFSARASAHPPSDIKIAFDKSSGTLKAVIDHPVSNRMTHHIKKVDIGLNGQEIRTLTFTEQAQKKTQPIEVLLPEVKAGDTLSVEAYCSISGRLEKKIKVA